MRLYSYVVRRDFGFAPNPFHGFCTLATCMPRIREHAQEGDWIVGTGSAEHKGREIRGHLVYAMKVNEVLTFDAYWADPRFVVKRPNLSGSLKYRMGDNIYHHDANSGAWCQSNSHHSLAGGQLNVRNLNKDTGTTERILVSEKFAYWGGEAIPVPADFRDFDGWDIVNVGVGHKCRFPEALPPSFEAWFDTQPDRGLVGLPGRFNAN